MNEQTLPMFNVATPVIARASTVTGVNLSDLIGRGGYGGQKAIRVRQAIMLVLREVCGLSWVRIAKEVGLKDHTTAIYGVAKARRLRSENDAFAILTKELHDVAVMVPSPEILSEDQAA